MLGVTAGLANLPAALAPDAVELRFEHFYEPKGPTSRSRTSATPSSRSASPWAPRSSACSASALAYLWYWRGLGPHGITQRNRVAQAGYTVLVNKYYFDHLYTDVIVGGGQGPGRPGV